MTTPIRAEEFFATEDLAALDAAGAVEILVGVHALNQARSVVRVLDAAAAGLAKAFPTRKAALVVADGGSRDGTPEAVRGWGEANAAAPPVRCVQLAGASSRGRAILALLTAAQRLQASACALVDGGLVSLSPEGLENLLQPLLGEGAEYVSPAYSHAVSEGTLTTNLLAPLARALYGKRIQQIVGGCAALSPPLGERFLAAAGEAGDLAERGAELWLPFEALASDARVVEAYQGRKSLDPGLAPPDLATILVRTVGPFFSLMERYQDAWADGRRTSSVPQTGGAAALLAEAGEVHLERMARAFRIGLKDLLPVWEQVMPEETLGQLYPLALPPAEEFRFPPALWARVACSFALAHHERRLPREHLLRALTPLYLGRVAAFLREAQAGPPGCLPDLLEGVGRAFETEMETVRARWR